MKCAAITVSVFVATHAFAQGFVGFDNRNLLDVSTGRVYQAPVSLPNGSPAGGSFTAGLFVARPTGLELIYTTPLNASGFFANGGDLAVPGIPAYAPATFRARVWETEAGSYANAISTGQYYYGEFVMASGSPDIFIPELGPQFGPGGIPIPNMSGIQPLTLIPEPAIAALAALGAALVVIATSRRKAAR